MRSFVQVVLSTTLIFGAVAASPSDRRDVQQPPRPKPKTETPKPPSSGSGTVRISTLVVQADLACHITVDGEDRGTLTANGTTLLRLRPGEHVIHATSEVDPEVTWGKVVEIAAGQRRAVLVELRKSFEERRSRSKPATETGASLLITMDTPGTVFVDGKEVGEFQQDVAKTVPVGLGEHLITGQTSGGLRVQSVVDVKTPSQHLVRLTPRGNSERDAAIEVDRLRRAREDEDAKRREVLDAEFSGRQRPPAALSGFGVGEILVGKQIQPHTGATGVGAIVIGGAVDWVPATEGEFRHSDEFCVFFRVYEAAGDARGKPAVRITYDFYRRPPSGEVFFNKTDPQVFSASTLPANFSVSQHPITAGQAVPVRVFPPGEYRLEITVIDDISKRKIVRSVIFRVRP